MSAKREVFVWKSWHEKVMLAEVSTVEPYKSKVGSKERGKAWREVSDNLNAIKELGFKTTHRSVREKFEKMLKGYKKKENEEERASGVDVEYSETDKALEDIMGRIVEVEEAQEIEREKVNKEKVTAEKMRSKAMESLSEKKKRVRKEQCSKDADTDDENDEKDEVTPKRKRSQASMTEVLNEAMSVKKQANEIRQRELELQSRDTAQNQMFLQNILVQQQQFQQQQQEMNQAFINALANLVKKN